MPDFAVIGEARADARLAIELAERVFQAQSEDWLRDFLSGEFKKFAWVGLQEGQVFSIWQNYKTIERAASTLGYKPRSYIGRPRDGKRANAYYAKAFKVLRLALWLKHSQIHPNLRAIVLLTDSDNLRDTTGFQQARDQFAENVDELEVVIGVAHTKREAWVLNGFVAQNKDEQAKIQEIRNVVGFDPCVQAHRLREKSREEGRRLRNVKVVVEILTDGDYEREAMCWRETELALLRKRGIETGLTAFLEEVEERLLPILHNE